MKKIAEITFYTCVPKTTIIWGMVPEIPSETDKYVVLLSNFLPFDSPNNSENGRCHHYTHVYQKITIIWCMLPEIWSVTVTTFCPFTPLLTPLKFKIWKKYTWRYYLLSYVYHKSRSYEVWFLRYKAQRTKFVLSFWGIYFPLTLPTTCKIKILKK